MIEIRLRADSDIRNSGKRTVRQVCDGDDLCPGRFQFINKLNDLDALSTPGNHNHGSFFGHLARVKELRGFDQAGWQTANMKKILHGHSSVPTAADAGDEKMSRMTNQLRSLIHSGSLRAQKKIQRVDQLLGLLKDILHEFCH